MSRAGGPAWAPVWVPTKVLLVDVDEAVPDVDPHRADEPPYGAVRIFAVRAGCPIGEVTLPLAGSTLPAAEVRDQLAALATAAAAGSGSGAPDRSPVVPCGQASAVADEMLPPATVVVASDFARVQPLHRCVAALAALDYPSYEVIVVDNRPAGAGRPDLAGHPGVRVLAQPRPGASAARNLGLARASGAIVAFTDDDTQPDRGWLRALGSRFVREPEAACVTGLVLPAELETPAQLWFERSGGAFTQRYRPASYAGGPFRVSDRCAPAPDRQLSVYRLGVFGTGANMAFRAEALRALGGFDEALGPGTPSRAGEDLAVFLRLLSGGHRLAYEPAAVVHHWHRREVADLLRQTTGYGVGFTAMVTAVVCGDPRHLVGLGRVAGPALALFLRGGRRQDGDGTPYPRAIARARRRAMLGGPLAYLRARRRLRQWR